MKSVVSILVLIVACVRFTSAAKCSDHILSLKADYFSEDDGGIYDSTACSASFSNFFKYTPQVHGLINEHIAQSFIYSIMSSHFETDFENRLGFSKYMDSLADTMWQHAISLIKYAGKRGTGVAPVDTSNGLSIKNLNNGIKPWTEIEALALALDHHQMLAVKVHQLHSSAKDAAFGDFLENQFVSDHVSRIRELSGHLTNLVPMVQEERSKDLALYLFDQSLA
ncbi:hypothetical protein GHT06_010710 [Daphnia sinensis]|uniref:Ferritin n=1 Tax=Daphnia sinensis TaxID=1820382 RepID=A0AAD5PXP4_9CRUS|nr:hypothetical protein GHT06_010710 [Daphnia sinensis]